MISYIEYGILEQAKLIYCDKANQWLLSVEGVGRVIDCKRT